MNQKLKDDILAILREGQDLTLATVRPDGSPQATTVSYASDGLAIYFGCGAQSQKARNLAHDSRVSLTINLPYADWAQIRGVSLGGVAKPVTDHQELDRASVLFMEKFTDIAQYVATPTTEMMMFRVYPQVISVLNYRKGFGHTDLVDATDLGIEAAAAA